MIQLVVKNINTRISYLADFLTDRWGIEVRPVDCNNEEEGGAIYYGCLNQKPKGIQIPESGFLEENILSASIEFINEELRINYTSDVLAAIFYLLTNAEVYTQKNRDEHGRFLCKYSKLPANFYSKPYVDIAIEKLKNELIEKGEIAANDFKEFKFQIQPTFDIDVAWAYGNRPLWREVAARMKDIAKRNTQRIQQRKAVLKGHVPDPYDTFDIIEDLAKKVQVHLFFLLGKYGNYDKNISPKNKALQHLIRKMSKSAKVGIHPSYRATNESQLESEISSLSQILNAAIVQSRQHFLKLDIPTTYRLLLSKGITDDYSMGFADQPGFRAGTTRPFYFYDLSREEALPICVHPFVYMDGTLNEYMQLSPEEAIDVILKLREEVQKVNGIFSFIWHNDTINNQGKWKGWKTVFESNFKK